MFRTVPLFIIRGFSLYTQQWYMSYRFADSLRAGQRNCPKHVKFYSKNKFEKLVHLVGFIIRIFSRCCAKNNKDRAGLKLCRHLNRQNCASCLTPYWRFIIHILPWANLCFVVITPTILDVCASAVLLCTCTVAVNAPSAWKIRTSYLRTASIFCKYAQVFL